MNVQLEVCVDSTEGMLAAVEGGADRIELCSALEVGGLTPSAGQMRRAAELRVPVHALIRSRAGDFRFGADEVATMVDDIRAARSAGLAGVVIGAARADGTLDEAALAAMIAAAEEMSVTLHRVFDLVPDFGAAVEAAVRLGCDRILTSGGALGAPEGADAIASICRMAAGRIGILPAAGITSANVVALVTNVPVSEVHSACGLEVPMAERAVAMDFCHPTRLTTDPGEVRAMKAALMTFSRDPA
ncbi:MAG: copper homeostasis protein CutC [Paracoccaceae bacterium]